FHAGFAVALLVGTAFSVAPEVGGMAAEMMPELVVDDRWIVRGVAEIRRPPREGLSVPAWAEMDLTGRSDGERFGYARCTRRQPVVAARQRAELASPHVAVALPVAGKSRPEMCADDDAEQG